MVRKLFILFAFLGLLFASTVYSVELDVDDNGATDIDKGGTNTQDGSISATKTSGVPGYLYLFEAETTNELFTGFQGPADLSVNISHVMPSSAGTVGQVFEIDTVQTGQTLANGETGTLVTLKNGDKGSATVTEQAADPTSASATGFYGATTSGDFFYKSDTGLYNFALGTYTLDPTIPTLTSATIPSAGTTVSLLFSEVITIGSGGNGGWTLNTPTNAMTYSSGDTTNTLIYTLASTINSTDTPTITYTQPGDGLENGTGGDLASIAAGAVVNNSTQTDLQTIFRPTSDSAQDQWVPSTGTDSYAVVNEAILDLGDYIEASAAYQTTALNVETMIDTGQTIDTVTIHVVAGSTVETVNNFKLVAYDGTILYNPAAYSDLTTTPTEYTWAMSINPSTSGAWTVSGFNALAYGVYNSTNSSGQDLRTYQIWVEVSYQ